jgi:hypothetical protein
LFTNNIFGDIGRLSSKVINEGHFESIKNIVGIRLRQYFNKLLGTEKSEIKGESFLLRMSAVDNHQVRSSFQLHFNIVAVLILMEIAFHQPATLLLLP